MSRPDSHDPLDPVRPEPDDPNLPDWWEDAVDIPRLEPVTASVRMPDPKLWDDLPTPKMTMCERVRRVLVQRAGCWVPAVDLEVGGRQAWRSRVSDLRQGGMTIENRVRRLPNGVARSEYRYRP